MVRAALPRVYICTTPRKILPPVGLLIGSRDSLVTPLVKELYPRQQVTPALRRLRFDQTPHVTTSEPCDTSHSQQGKVTEDTAARDAREQELLPLAQVFRQSKAVFDAIVPQVMAAVQDRVLLVPPQVLHTLSLHKAVGDLVHRRHVPSPAQYAQQTGLLV